MIASWRQLRTTVSHARLVPGCSRFLVGRFFYTVRAVNTVIVVMSVFPCRPSG